MTLPVSLWFLCQEKKMKKNPLVSTLNEVEKLKKLRQITSKQIPLNNDVFMIFAMNKKFCQEFLRVILQDEKLVVMENDIQKNLPSAFSKSVIIDMLCRLGDGRIVNVEIQLSEERWHAKRILAYASKIKSYTTDKGTKYSDIKDLVIIYLTKKDIFNKGSTVYGGEMNVVSDQGEQVSRWKPGLQVYYVNTVGLTNRNINNYLRLLTDNITISSKYKITSEIKELVYKRGGSKMSSEMRKFMDELREEGREEGRQEGRQEGKTGILIEMVKDKVLSMAEAARRIGMSEEQFAALVK